MIRERSMQKAKVVIQYPFIPHYRIPIFQLLAGSTHYDFMFWAGKSSPDKFLKSSFNGTGLRIEEIPLTTVKIPLINKVFEFQFSALQKLLKYRPDVYIILANPNSISSWFCMILARLVGCTVLTWTHGFLVNEAGFKGYLRALFYKLAHGHLLYGNRAREIMTKKGFDKKRLDVIYNSLDYAIQSSLRDTLNLADREQTRKQLGIDIDGLVLISIGRLMTKLKLDQAIRGLEILNSMGRKTYLLVIGDGPEKRPLELLVNELNLTSHVIFYGACHDESVLSRLYNASDISVVMGKVGLSAMHSLAYGIPMITNNSSTQHFPEIEAITEGETGWFFKENDISSFVNKIQYLPYRGKYYWQCIRTIEGHYTPARQLVFIEDAIKKYLCLKELHT